MALRRLFMTHAGELAHLLARAVGPGALVARFIRSYAERHNRQAVLGNAQQFREIESTIGREALLVMAIEVRRRVPRAFTSRATPRPEEAAVAQVFAAEFMASLGRIVAGRAQEPQEEPSAFNRDLQLYDHWTMRRSPRAAAPSATTTAESPFPDRCAMLLDPSMMETARREAADFEMQLVREGGRIFENLGRHALRRGAPSPHRIRRPVRRARKAARPLVKLAKRAAKRSLGKTVKKSPPARKSPRRKLSRRRKR